MDILLSEVLRIIRWNTVTGTLMVESRKQQALAGKA
jgi:hypothetical protein